MISWDCGEMKEGRFADCLLALKMRAMRFVFVSSAAYTTVKQKPAPNLEWKTEWKAENWKSFSIQIAPVLSKASTRKLLKISSRYFPTSRENVFLCEINLTSCFWPSLSISLLDPFSRQTEETWTLIYVECPFLRLWCLSKDLALQTLFWFPLCEICGGGKLHSLLLMSVNKCLIE